VHVNSVDRGVGSQQQEQEHGQEQQQQDDGDGDGQVIRPQLKRRRLSGPVLMPPPPLTSQNPVVKRKTPHVIILSFKSLVTKPDALSPAIHPTSSQGHGCMVMSMGMDPHLLVFHAFIRVRIHFLVNVRIWICVHV
jgi:hypothetical protein